jgi:transcriptional regulator with XRE-family HTH domain
MTTFAERLKAARLKAGYSQNELARASGVPVGTIRDYEQKRRDPGLSTIVKLMAALGASLDELTGLSRQARSAPAKKSKTKE